MTISAEEIEDLLNESPKDIRSKASRACFGLVIIFLLRNIAFLLLGWEDTIWNPFFLCRGLAGMWMNFVWHRTWHMTYGTDAKANGTVFPDRGTTEIA
jgi:hypothetical protein